MEALCEKYWNGLSKQEDSVSPKTNPVCWLHKFSPDLAFMLTFANVVVLDTSEGLVLVDCGHSSFGNVIKKRIRRAFPGKKVHTCIYTHGHVDHVMGIMQFEELSKVRVIGHRNVAQRFDRYKLTVGYNAAINVKQFNAPSGWPSSFRYPDVVYDDQLVITVGGEQLELYHHRGETDDATWVFMPKRRVLCTGDFFIWASPNCGNPQKVQRYPIDWALAMRKMMSLNAELLLPGHGPPVIGAQRVREALENSALLLEDIVQQAMKGINSGKRLAEIVRGVVLPEHLLSKPYLHPVYDDPRFIVHNVWRQFAGWWDQDPAHLRVGYDLEIATEVAAFAGGALPLAQRAELLAIENKLDPAVQLIEWAVRLEPNNVDVHAIRADIYRRKVEAESSLMAKGIYTAAQMDSEQMLDSPAWKYRQIEYSVAARAERLDMLYELGVAFHFCRQWSQWLRTHVVGLLQILGLLAWVMSVLNRVPLLRAMIRPRRGRLPPPPAAATTALATQAHGHAHRHRPSAAALAHATAATAGTATASRTATLTGEGAAASAAVTSSSLVWPPTHRFAAQATTLVARAKELIAEPNDEAHGWKTLQTAKDVVVTKKTSPTGTPLGVLRGDGIVEGYSPTEVLAAAILPSCRREWDKMFEDARVVEQLDGSTMLSHASAKGQFPVSGRDMSVIVVTEYTPDGRIYSMNTSVQDERIPDVKGKVRANLKLNVWYFEPLPEAKGTRVVYISEIDLVGWIPDAILQMVAMQMPLAVAHVRSYLQRHGPPPFFAAIAGRPASAASFDHHTNEFQVKLQVDSRIAPASRLLLSRQRFPKGCEVTVVPTGIVNAELANDDREVILRPVDAIHNDSEITVTVRPNRNESHGYEVVINGGMDAHHAHAHVHDAECSH